jgi:hypothetical protein
VPAHLKTISITPVVDNSGFGNPNYKVELENGLTDIFLKDNSFEVIERNGDATLTVSIVSINEMTNTVSAGELESEKRVTLSCSVEYFDNVNNKQI